MSEITIITTANYFGNGLIKICAIPHPSHHEDALATFIVNWAKEKQFFCRA